MLPAGRDATIPLIRSRGLRQEFCRQQPAKIQDKDSILVEEWDRPAVYISRGFVRVFEAISDGTLTKARAGESGKLVGRSEQKPELFSDHL